MSLVQYVILRKDLQTVLKWPLGALIAQGCHACSAIIHLSKDDEHTIEYLSKLDTMHKVVLSTPDLESLMDLAKKLEEKDIKFKLWMEQPENIPTCIAIKPYPRDVIKTLLRHLELYK